MLMLLFTPLYSENKKKVNERNKHNAFKINQGSMHVLTESERKHGSDNFFKLYDQASCDSTILASLKLLLLKLVQKTKG